MPVGGYVTGGRVVVVVLVVVVVETVLAPWYVYSVS